MPGLIKDKEALISTLADRLEMAEETIREKVETDVPSYYFIPLKTLPYGTPDEVIEPFYHIEGVVVRSQLQRAYPQGSLAGHTLGYLMEVSEEQLQDLAGEGYQAGDLPGRRDQSGGYPRNDGSTQGEQYLWCQRPGDKYSATEPLVGCAVRFESIGYLAGQ